MKERDIRFTIYSAVFLIAIIPALILFMVLTSEASRELELRDRSYLTGFLNEKIGNIGEEINSAIDLTDRISAEILPPILESASLSEEENALNELSHANGSLRSLHLFDENRKPLTGSPDNPYSRRVTEELTGRIFSEPLSLDYISFPDNNSLLCLYRKHVYNGELIGYSAILMDFSKIESQLLLPEDLNLDVFDEEYKLLATTTEKQLGVVTINDLTRLMVDGYSDIMAFDQNVHAFTFLNLGETSLYLTVYQQENEHGRHSGGRFSLFFFMAILLFASFVTAWKLHKEVLKFGERILVKKSYSGDMRFFSRLKGNIQSLSENAKVFEKIESQLKYMENDIEYIIDNIPETNDEKGE